MLRNSSMPKEPSEHEFGEEEPSEHESGVEKEEEDLRMEASEHESGGAAVGAATEVTAKRGKVSADLCALRLSALRAIKFSLNRLQRVLKRQRAHYEDRVPEMAVAMERALIPPTSDELKARQDAVEAAYVVLEGQAALLRTSLQNVRMAETALEPTASWTPAAVAFSVSAPGSQWSVDQVFSDGTPHPRVLNTLKSLFEAAYSNPDKKKNKLKKPYLGSKKKAKLGDTVTQI